LENNLFFTNCRYNRLWYIYRDQSARKKKKYQQDVCMYEYVDAHETRQTIVGGKILSLYHKVAFFMYERAVFLESTGGQWA